MTVPKHDLRYIYSCFLSGLMVTRVGAALPVEVSSAWCQQLRSSFFHALWFQHWCVCVCVLWSSKCTWLMPATCCRHTLWVWGAFLWACCYTDLAFVERTSCQSRSTRWLQLSSGTPARSFWWRSRALDKSLAALGNFPSPVLGCQATANLTLPRNKLKKYSGWPL